MSIQSNFQERFNLLAEKLKKSGFTGEVLINENGLLVSAFDLYSRQVLKVLEKRNKDIITYFPIKSHFGFACWTPELSAKEAKVLLKNEAEKQLNNSKTQQRKLTTMTPDFELQDLKRKALNVFCDDASFELDFNFEEKVFSLQVPTKKVYLAGLTYKELKFYIYGYSDAKKA